MKNYKLLIFLLLPLIGAFCGDHTDTKSLDIIDSYLENMISQHGIPGLALAVIQNDTVVYERYIGKSSLEENTEVGEQTLFRIFSATKLITATAVFQLIEQGGLSLHDSIGKHLNNIPDKWKDVKLAHLLTHSSGIPDVVRYDSELSDEDLMMALSKDDMYYEAGEKFQYNQTNYWILAQIIENVSQMSFEQYVYANQFDGGNASVLFSSNTNDVIPNRATRYYYNRKTKSYDVDPNNNHKRGHSGNGLNITLNEFIKWNGKLNHNDLLSAETKSAMWTRFDYDKEDDKFYHGWGSYSANQIESIGFTGGNLASFRVFEEQGITIIFLSNGYKIPAHDIMVNDIARMVLPNLSDKDKVLESDIINLVLKEKYQEAKVLYRKLKDENPEDSLSNLMSSINGIGNNLLAIEDNQSALSLFNFNAEVNPDWWISRAAYAEALEIDNDMQMALKEYKIAIGLNVNNEYGYNELMIDKISELVGE